MLDSGEPFEPHHANILDAFCALLQKKMRFEEGERDMAFMFHELVIVSGTGKKARLTSTLIEYGDPTKYSAMAKTVGVPAAIATEMMLDGKLKKRGVIAPLEKTIYTPLLESLSHQGIRFKETIV